MKGVSCTILILIINFNSGFTDYAVVDFNILKLYPMTQDSVEKFAAINNNTWTKTYSAEYDFFTRLQIVQVYNTSIVYEWEWWSSND